MNMKINFKSTTNQRYLISFALIFLGIIFILIDVRLAFSADKEITFYFDPPDGTTFIETVRSTKEIIIEGRPESEAKISELQSKFLIRKTDFGYSIVVTPLQSRVKVSEDIAGIQRSLLSSLILTYDLDSHGKLIRVRGLEDGLEELKKRIPLPPEMWDLLMSIGLAGRTPEQIAIDNWNNRGMFGLFVGQTMIVNKVYSQKGKLPLPAGGTILASTELKISGLENCNGHRCARFQATCKSDDSIMGEQLNEILKNMILGIFNLVLSPEEAAEVAKGFRQLEVSDPKVLHKGERLVDPNTGLIYSEIETRTIHLIMKLEGEKDRKFKLLEKNEYSYTY